MDPEIVLLDSSKCKYFTGLYLDEFDVLFEFLGPTKHNLNYCNPTARKKGKSSKQVAIHYLQKKSSYLWRLMRLRRGFNIYTLSSFYSVSEFYIRKVFTTWMFWYHHFCEVPRNYAQQGNLYCSYKHHTTIKCLIAVNPDGAACFISDLFVGSIDNDALFNQYRIMN